MPNVLEIENLNIRCDGKSIVGSANLNVPPRSVTAIVGPSGGGKTTLLRAINRLLEEDRGFEVRGTIRLHQQSLYDPSLCKYELRRRIGLVFQKPTIFPISIFKNVVFGIRHVAPLPRAEYPQLVEQCLREAFLWEETKDRLDEPALHLSIGQQQRLAVARALATRPEILLMDEPTSALDKNAAAEIERLILRLKENTAVLIVTHDEAQAERISDQVIRVEPYPGGSQTRRVGGEA